MSIFQNTVVAKHLKGQNSETITAKWNSYKDHFQNPTIQKNIRNSKEEQYQGGFIIDLFVNVLGYTKNPAPNFNITTEYKNVKDSKKADAAIIINDVVKAVIELKGTNTTDLSKVETQAFGYKNNQPQCTYVVTSNFEKLRFYIDNAIEHTEFNLFTLTEEEFNLLYLCLAYENIKKDIPKKIKEESVSEEDAITKKLYKDYSLFRRELHHSLVELNPQYDALTLFKKTQKLLDRFLFLFFAEDRHLLPPNSVRLILKQWEKLKELDAYTPLFDRFKKYFGYLNTGFKGKQYDVYAYNGGLFKADEVLDAITIDDDLLYKHTLTLSEYDFNSEVDVNILGHIFENSLTEIEEIQAQLEGQEKEKTTSKRKKDGVFYTPKYITKYIVENTVGKLCEEKKVDLKIDEEDYTLDKKRQKKTRKALLDKLTEYRNWLLKLTICDPACGSGAFLNQALDFLIIEHSYIDELQAKLFGDAMVLSDVENSILENNLFGVDINEESVEIAKLSLWLRTAQPNRKLNDLSNNIKCGNSLIDDIEVAGEKAFKWEDEFPQIFKEKDKKIYHITTAIHDSRTSKRMLKYKVRERRDMGTNPYPNVIYFTKEDDLLITQTIAQVVKEEKLNLLAFNICADHIHLLLACDMEDIPRIMQKIKGRSSFVHHNKGFHKGFKPLAEEERKQKKPLWQQKYSSPKEVTSQEQLHNTLDYIQNNRHKHELPAHSHQLKTLIETMCCDLDTALNPEYTGGFDCVIGNPPYVNSKEEMFSKEVKSFFISNYETSAYQIDLYILFLEKSINLICKNGVSSLIVPNSWLNNVFLDKVREYFLTTIKINEIVSMPSKTFMGANVDTVIVTFSNFDKNTTTKLTKCDNGQFETIGIQNQSEWLLEKGSVINIHITKDINAILKKITRNSLSLESMADIGRGVGVYHKRVGHTKEFIANNPFQSSEKKDETFLPYLRGRNVQSGFLNWNNDSFISYGDWLAEPREPKFFTGDRIVLRQIPSKRLIVSFLKEDFVIDQSVFIARFYEDSKYKTKSIASILGSKLLSFYFRFYYSEFDDLFPKVKLQHFKLFPISKKIAGSNLEFENKSESFLSFNKELQLANQKFQRLLQRKFDLEKLPKKLQEWYSLNFAEFIKELKKKKIKLSLTEEAEWEDYFLKEQQKALEIKSKIDATDAAIDQMAYELYGLTEEEIAIVENG